MADDRPYSGPARLFLYLDAVRGMRVRQVAWRVRRLIPPALLATGTRVGRTPRARLLAAGLGCSPAPQSGPTEPPHETGEFAGYGASRRFDEPRFWDDPRDGLLFLFHLHGFAPLAEYAAAPLTPDGDAFWAQLVRDWLKRHERAKEPAWHPYPTSERIVSWSVALSTLEGWPGNLRDEVAAAILRQARYLRRAVEHDIGGNHVIKNGTALVFAGAVFPSTPLLDTGLRLLERETRRQVLGDGGHEERSTSYQREVMAHLADVRELLARSSDGIPVWLEDVLERMERWLGAMAGPDGRLPLMNDAWDGPPVTHGDGGSRVLKESGYVVLRHAEDQLVFDSGPLCPRHLPAHAHADALSVVVWFDGEPVIIDRGSGAYSGRVREQSRSTRAHNTVEVEGEDQCIFLDTFRAARLPRVAEPVIEEHGEVIVVSSAHTGYQRLAVPVEHARSVVWWPGHGVVLLDRVLGEGTVRVRSVLTMAPGALDKRVTTRQLLLRALGPLGVPLRRETVWWPFFGSDDKTDALELEGELTPGTVFGWSILRPGADVVECDPERITLSVGHLRTEIPLAWRVGSFRA